VHVLTAPPGAAGRPTHDGSAHDSSAHDSSAHDSSAHDSSAHDSGAHDGPTRDGRSHDADLVAQARSGSAAALRELLDAYRPLARSRASAYFLAGADRDDVVQEAMIGLLSAVQGFDPLRGASFATFAELCITRQIVTAVKTAARHKHGPLNDYVPLSLADAAADRGDRALVRALRRKPSQDPVEQVISRERLSALQTHVDTALSELEIDVLRLHVDGRSHAEIAALLDRGPKAVDNALQRARRKLAVRLGAGELADAG
jgi:RNA polymerase sporulation-specific sigma factor